MNRKTESLGTWLRRGATALYLLFLALTVALQNTDSIWGNGESWVDASVYKYVAWMMDLGYMPYKDTFDHKGPLVYLFFWVGRQISEWRGVWVPYTVMVILIFVLLYRILRRFCTPVMSLLLMTVMFAVCFDYEIANMCPEGLSIPFMAVGLLIFVDYFLFDRISIGRLLCTGAAFGCVLMIKAQMVSVWFVFCIAVLVKCILDKRIGKVAWFLAWFLIGCALVVLPVCVWLVRGGAWKDFIGDYIIFNMKYSRSYSGATALEGIVAKARSMVFFINKPVVLLCLLICIALIRLDAEYRFFHVTYLLYMLVSIAAASLSGRNYGHYGTSLIVAVTCPLAFFFSGRVFAKIRSTESPEAEGEERQAAPGTAADGKEKEAAPGTAGDREAIADSGRGPRGWIRGLLAVGIAYLVCIYASPVLFTRVDNAFNAWNEHLTGETALSSNLQGMLDIIYANTDEEDTITVHGLYDILYGKSGRRSASKYTFQHALPLVDPERYDEYFAELEANPPKLIIQYGADRERMIEFAAAHGYRKIATSENGEFTIFKLFGDIVDTRPAWAQELHEITDFTQYLDALGRLEEDHDLLVCIAVRGTQGKALSVQNVRQLETLGFTGTDILLDTESRHTFLGVSKRHESLYEALGRNGADRCEGSFEGRKAVLISAVERKGDQASILLDETEYAVGQRGFNIVVYDPETFAVVDSAAFDTEDPAVPCRR